MLIYTYISPPPIPNQKESPAKLNMHGECGGRGQTRVLARGGVHWFSWSFCSKKVRANARMRGQV